MSQEAPRRSGCRRRLAKMEIAAFEAEQQIVTAQRDEKVDAFPWEVLGESILEDQGSIVLATERPAGRNADVAKKRAAVLNAALAATPEAQKGSLKYWKDMLRRNWERAKNFARTARNKGQLNPEIAKALEMDVKKSAKTSILERIN